MPLVLDASVVLSWLLPDERSDEAQTIVERVVDETFQAPALVDFEVANALLQAARRGRVPQSFVRELLSTWLELPVGRDLADPDAIVRGAALAERHSLSAYDAAYVELAIRRGFALATFDAALARAARAEAVPLA